MKQIAAIKILSIRVTWGKANQPGIWGLIDWQTAEEM